MNNSDKSREFNREDSINSLYFQNYGGTVINVQPYSNETTRHALPISTVDWLNQTAGQVNPSLGIQLMDGEEKLYIDQLTEIEDLRKIIKTKNRYVVKKSNGETIFGGQEMSSSWQRLFCSSKRNFQMKLHDKTGQEAIYLERRLACCSPLSPFYLEGVEVFVAPFHFVGRVCQKWSLLSPRFEIRNEHSDLVYIVTGPERFTWTCGEVPVFTIFSPDSVLVLGTIGRENSQSDFSLSVKFPTFAISNKKKALIVACAFMLEYLYFDTSPTTWGKLLSKFKMSPLEGN